MTGHVDLYESHYGNVEDDVYRAIRMEAFGEDLGQTSWITAPECDEFGRWLKLTSQSRILEIACGTGGVSTRFAAQYEASVVGVDINESAVRSADARAEFLGVQKRATFQTVNADEPCPFPDESFDVVFCNDAINHLRDRAGVLADWRRLLRPGGFCLYTDPIVVTGCLSHDEIATRSSVGFFLFTPLGTNEKFLENAGLRIRRTENLTSSVRDTSKRWFDARARRQESLCDLEGESGFRKVQLFLKTVHRLSDERRLSRFAFLSEK